MNFSDNLAFLIFFLQRNVHSVYEFFVILVAAVQRLLHDFVRETFVFQTKGLADLMGKLFRRMID